MGKLAYVVLGGDPKSPAVKRFLSRLAASVVSLLAVSIFLSIYYDGGYQAALMFSVRAIFIAFMSYEGWRLFRDADELLQRLMLQSYALSCALILVGALLYYAAIIYLGLPEPTFRQAIAAISLVIVFSWLSIAPRIL